MHISRVKIPKCIKNGMFITIFSIEIDCRIENTFVIYICAREHFFYCKLIEV